MLDGSRYQPRFEFNDTPPSAPQSACAFHKHIFGSRTGSCFAQCSCRHNSQLDAIVICKMGDGVLRENKAAAVQVS